MNEKERSEEYFAELSEHRAGGDANEAHAEGTIFPRGEPVKATGRYASPREDEPDDVTATGEATSDEENRF